MLSAVRAGFDLSTKHANAFAPVFDCIGRRLDAAVCQPDFDSFFINDARQIIVAISDASWTDAAAVTAYSEHDVGPISTAADQALKATIRDCRSIGSDVSPDEVISVVWANWTGQALTSIRGNETSSKTLPDLAVGTLFSRSASVRGQLDAIAMAGGTPVLAIALNSIGSTSQRPKCSVRAIVTTFPTWACASGAVAGHG
ncbi:MAG: hypothetical protein JWQ24_466 [Tardiphaga sp.]|nr:hypothetical protein [Tardiphaga sp.]